MASKPYLEYTADVKNIRGLDVAAQTLWAGVSWGFRLIISYGITFILFQPFIFASSRAMDSAEVISRLNHHGIVQAPVSATLEQVGRSVPHPSFSCKGVSFPDTYLIF